MSPRGVRAKIRLSEDTLIPGRVATFHVRVDLREPVRIRGAHVTFTGFEETKAVYTTSNGKTTTTHTATERHTLIEEIDTFAGRPSEGAFSNLKDGALTLLGGGTHERLGAGTHDVRLEVDLPADLPESFEAKKVKVAYEAEVHLDVPAGRDFRETVTFEIPAESVDVEIDPQPLFIRYPEDSRRGFFDSMFGPNVAMRVDLASTVVRRGHAFTGELDVQFRDKPARVKAFVCELIRHEQSEAQKHRDKHSESVVKIRLAQASQSATSLFTQFDVPLPYDLVPTSSGEKFTIGYELAISLDVPWAKDPTVRIPVTVI